MLTALPPETKTAIEDDRPITIGRIDQPDYYVLAHEAKNRGDHSRAVTLLAMAARDLGVEVFVFGDVLLDWESHIDAVDRAWAERQVLSTANPKPAIDRPRFLLIPEHDIFIDAIVAYESGRQTAASTLLRVLAMAMQVDCDWTGSIDQDWTRNFDAVHEAWLKFWGEAHSQHSYLHRS
jgi:hypothetical protein